MASGSFQGDCVLGNFQVTTLMLFTPLLTLFCQFFLFVGKAAGFADVECDIVFT